jgi:2-polyprenyl-3-methyl-5-hydroxy-6-metoxy-1,4-benzoquinol methylase
VKAGSDAFGHAVLDWARGGAIPEMIERDDGLTTIGAGPLVYLSDVKGWPSAERQSMRYVRGRVLDVGCGAGRVTLHLQRRGFDAVGLDASSLAIQAARLRGVKQLRCASLETLASNIGSFDTVVMFGNNFGIFGSTERARKILTQWAKKTNPRARIFLESTNPYCGGAPGIDRAYYRRNKERGNSPGLARFRYHYDHYVGSWFSWLYVSRSELRVLVRGTGWHLAHVLGEHSSEPYVAILERD